MDYRVTPFSKKELLRVYTDVAPEHFPQNELKPVSAIYSLLERKAYIGLGLYEMETEHLVGYALFLNGLFGLSQLYLYPETLANTHIVRHFSGENKIYIKHTVFNFGYYFCNF